MREKFEKIPPPLQKQIIMRCGAALVSLLLMVVSLLLEGNLYLSLSVLLFFAFYGFSALQLLYKAVTDQIVVIRGHCTGLEKTPMRRRIKTLYLWSDPHIVKIQISGKLRNVDEGDIITVYTATGTPVYLDVDCPYLTVRRAWHTENNRPVILDELKTKAAHRNIPLPVCLADCLKETKANSQSEYVVSNRDGDPLSYTQFKRLWQYIVTRTVKERFYYRYEDGKRVKHTVTPVLGEKAAHNGKVIYSLDFEVTPHQLRHTYITNLIHSSVDPKTVQYLAGHESSKITMDIYAKVKYNRPDELVRTMGGAFAQWDAAQA